MNQDSRRNLVLVTIDSLRADHCGFVNPDSDLTPTIDELAADGVCFTQAIAPGPRTPSSIPVIFTGEFPSARNQAVGWRERRERIGRHLHRFEVLAEHFQEAGYETRAVTANPWTATDTAFDLGFDEFHDVSAGAGGISDESFSGSCLFKLADRLLDSGAWHPINWDGIKPWFAQWDTYFDVITDQLNELSEPFFLWVFLLDPHQPYISSRSFREENSLPEMYYAALRFWRAKKSQEVPPPHARRLIERAYRDTVRSVDSFMSALVESFEHIDPVVAFHADHGEALGEHGNYSHPQSLYEENLRIPFFLHNVNPTEVVNEQMSLQRLPEILSAVMEPHSFDPSSYNDTFIISKTEDHSTQSVRTGRWKLIVNEERTQLFDLASDPNETTDVSADFQTVTSALNTVLDRKVATQREKDLIGETAPKVADSNSSL